MATNISNLALILELFQDDLDEEELILLLILYRNDKNYHKKYARWSKQRLDALSETECRLDFRFTASEIYELIDRLQVPDELRNDDNGLLFSGFEGFSVLLRRMIYPHRLHDHIKTFGRSIPELSVIFNTTLEFLYSTWGQLLTDPWNSAWFQNNLTIFAQVIANKGCTVDNLIGFVDGTVRPTCRPKHHQRELFNGHDRVHALKFQNTVVPNGIIAHQFGPYEGRRHDAALMRDSRLLQGLSQLAINNNPVRVFGDKAYAINRHLITPFKGANLTQDEQDFNQAMSTYREPVEWGFKLTSSLFAFVNYKHNLKVYLQPVAQYYTVATLLTNCHTCFNGNQISQFYGMDPPSLQDYLA